MISFYIDPGVVTLFLLIYNKFLTLIILKSYENSRRILVERFKNCLLLDGILNMYRFRIEFSHGAVKGG